MLKKLKKLLGFTKEEKWLLKPEAFPEVISQIDKKVREENANLRAESIEKDKIIKTLQRKVDKIEEREAKKESAELGKKVVKKEMELEKKEEVKRVRFKMMGVQPNFLTASRKFIGEYKKLYGLELYETDYGGFIFVPLLIDGKKITRMKHGVFNLANMFRDTSNIVSQFKSGVVHSNFDVNEDGELIFLSNNDPPESSRDIDIKEIDKLVAGKNLQIVKLRSRLADTAKREKKIKAERDDLEMANVINSNTADYYKSFAGAAIEKQQPILFEHGKLLLANQDMTVNSALNQKLATQLLEAVDKKDELIASIRSLRIGALEREKLIEDVERIYGIIKVATPQVVAKTPEEKPVAGGKPATK